jgi:AbrB family looped-hinge helix DNA binding protein
VSSTIDKAGRLVIPAPLRKRLGLDPGTEIEFLVEGFSLRLIRAVPGPEIVERNGRLSASPRRSRNELPPVDIAELIEEERDRWPD